MSEKRETPTNSDGGAVIYVDVVQSIAASVG